MKKNENVKKIAKENVGSLNRFYEVRRKLQIDIL